MIKNTRSKNNLSKGTIIAGCYEDRVDLMNRDGYFQIRLDCMKMPEEELVIKRFFGTLEQVGGLLSEIDKDMAEHNCKEFLQGDEVKIKKYLYVLRPILACKWILRRQTKPPILFRELAASELKNSLKPAVDRLLDLKMNAPEIKEIPRIKEINNYIDRTIEELKTEIAAFSAEHRTDWAPLNQLFLQTLLDAAKPISVGEQIDLAAESILHRYCAAFEELDI